MSKRDYYETLEVSRDSSSAELKKAFEKKKLNYNHARNPANPETTSNCKEAAEEDGILSDPTKQTVEEQSGLKGLSGKG